MCGEKKVEIRTRRVALEAGSYLWIYSTLPVGAIQAVAKVLGTEHMSPTKAWEKFAETIGLTRAAYRAYVNGSRIVSVIRLADVVELSEPLSLDNIRMSIANFQPPQFLKSLGKGDILYRMLRKGAPELV
jgi:predicted transcriptional regulator